MRRASSRRLWAPCQRTVLQPIHELPHFGALSLLRYLINLMAHNLQLQTRQSQMAKNKMAVYVAAVR
nr:hypothetical protein I308_01867 [Cryptococcus tetragattii IND107]